MRILKIFCLEMEKNYGRINDRQYKYITNIKNENKNNDEEGIL